MESIYYGLHFNLKVKEVTFSMKKYLVILILFFIINSVSAQYFELTFEDTVGQIDPQNHSLLLAGYLKNISGSTMDFQMIRLQNNLPAPPPAWSSAICLGLCVAPSIDTISTRDFGLSLNPGDSILTEVVFAQTDTIPGVATVQIKYATLDESQVEIQWFEAYTILNKIHKKSSIKVYVFKVKNNFPNPFNNQTVISANVTKSSALTLKIFDMLGREIYTKNKSISSAGNVGFNWNGTNKFGEGVSSGIYFYQISEYSHGKTNRSKIRKMTLLK